MEPTSPIKQPALAGHLSRRAVRATLIGILSDIALCFVKGGAGWLGGSYALLADAGESLADAAKGLAVYTGLKLAAIPPDAKHPYGHGKAEPIAAALVAGGIILTAGALALASLQRIAGSSAIVPPAPFTLAVLIGVIAVKELLFRFVVREGQALQSSVLQADAWHHRSDAITSVAGLIGVGIAVLGGSAWAAADAWAALAACGILAFNGTRLIGPALDEIMDAAPAQAIAQEARAIAAQVEGVLALEDCRVRKMGLEYFIDLHVAVDGELSVREGHEVAHRVKDAIRLNEPRIRDVLVHVEPAEAPPRPSTVT